MTATPALAAAFAARLQLPADDRPKLEALIVAAGTDDLQYVTAACARSAADEHDRRLDGTRSCAEEAVHRLRGDLMLTGLQLLGPIVVSPVPHPMPGTIVFEARAVAVPVDVVHLEVPRS